VVENGEALGMAAIRRDPRAEDVVTGRLCFIFVSERARKRGLAEALVRACLTRGDMRWARVTLHTDNPVAAALYGRHGFAAVPGGTRTTHQRLAHTQI
jgi:ribosomal protein S18 acetylase RimI-like enzyme